jgi:hypothetical protein
MMAKDSGSVRNGTIHTVRFSKSAKILYPYHPLFGQELEIFGGAGGQRDLIYVMLSDRTTRGVPGWMFDEVICSSVRTADHPTIDGGALLRLAQLLDSFQAGRCIGEDENKPCSQDPTNTVSPPIATNATVGSCGVAPTNPGREPDQVRSVALRTTGARRSPGKIQPRRRQQ